jgi:hypothetical protein
VSGLGKKERGRELCRVELIRHLGEGLEQRMK